MGFEFDSIMVKPDESMLEKIEKVKNYIDRDEYDHLLVLDKKLPVHDPGFGVMDSNNGKIYKYKPLWRFRVENNTINLIFIRFCNITIIPEEIFQFHNLKHIEILECPIETFSENIIQLKSLEIFCLKGVNLTSLPQNFFKLDSLQGIEFINRNFGTMRTTFEFPLEKFLFPKLSFLRLQGGINKDVPPSLGINKELTSLDLSYNNISSLAVELESLQNLTEISLNKNNLKNIPELICNLQNLKVLEITFNRLTNVPKCLTKLEKLEKIDLRGNEIEEVLIELVEMKKLDELVLLGNKIKNKQELFEFFDLKQKKIIL